MHLQPQSPTLVRSHIVRLAIALDARTPGPVQDLSFVARWPRARDLTLSDWPNSLRINSLAAFAGFGALALGRSQDAPAYTHLFLQCGAAAMLISGLWLAFAGHKPRPRRNAQSLFLNAMPAFVFIAWVQAPFGRRLQSPSSPFAVTLPQRPWVFRSPPVGAPDVS